MAREDWKQRAVDAIRAAGETLMEDAEIMLGGYKFQTGELEIIVPVAPTDQTPTITVTQRLYPNAMDILWKESDV